MATKGVQVVADEEGLAGVGEAVKLVGFVLLAGEGAFEVGDECPGDLIVLGDALRGGSGVRTRVSGGAENRRGKLKKSFRAAGPTWSAQSCVNLVADLIGGGSEMTALVTDATRARRATGLEPRRRSAGLA